uniref:NR LBD domain-containing protein n=1 Tax=Rhabditophanes sp. KR3021 TaxID=114890 RepID=A0AC35TV18_9BILA
MKEQRVYQCRRNLKNCPIKFGDNKKCRYCRLAKCKFLGMQWKRNSVASAVNELITSTPSESNSNCSQQMLGTPDYLLNNIVTTYKTDEGKDIVILEIPTNSQRTYKKIICESDAHFIKLKEILRSSQKKIPTHLPQDFAILQDMCYGINEFEQRLHYLKANEIIISNKLAIRNLPSYIDKATLNTAYFMLYSTEFCQLNNRDRAIVFNSFWSLLMSIERIYFSIKKFGSKSKESYILFDNKQAHDENFGTVVDSTITEEEANQIFDIFMPANKIMFENIYIPMKRLDVDLYEFGFMLAQMMWSLDDCTGLSEDAKRIGDAALISVSNDLHSYYTINKNENNYSYRLSEIMKICSHVHNYNRAKSEVAIAGRVFELFEKSQLYDEKMELKDPRMIFLMN